MSIANAKLSASPDRFAIANCAHRTSLADIENSFSRYCQYILPFVNRDCGRNHLPYSKVLIWIVDHKLHRHVSGLGIGNLPDKSHLASRIQCTIMLIATRGALFEAFRCDVCRFADGNCALQSVPEARQ